MIAILLSAAVASTLLIGVGGLHRPASLAPCWRVWDLEPRATAGEPARVESTLTRHGALLRWGAGKGESLRLKLRVEAAGTYTVSVFAVGGPDGPAMSAKLWDDPLTLQGETTLPLRRDSEAELFGVRFDPVSLGPGHHFLELSFLEPGEVLLDCVALRRTGDWVAALAGKGGEGRPFLGVEIGEARAGGVAINRTVPDSAAAAAGLEAGDVLLSINGRPTDARQRLTNAILAHRPGDRLELTLSRDGRLIEKMVVLGRRSEPDRRDGSRIARVIEVLDLQPGQVIADIGCGSGWLSEAIAERVGEEGLVYAVEIDEGDIRRLRRGTMPNVIPVLSVPDDASLPERSLDTAMLHDVASHVSRSVRPRFYASVASALKPDGKLVIFGPHGKARAMLDELRKYGFIPRNDEALAALPPADLDQRLKEGIVFHYRP